MRLRDLMPRPRGATSTLENPSTPLFEAITGGATATATGVAMSPDRSLNVVAVYAAVRVLTDALAGLPFVVYRRSDRGRMRASDDWRSRLLDDQPNPEMTAFELWELVLGGLLLHGNAYAVKLSQPGKASRPGRVGEWFELWPLDPAATKPIRDRAGRRFFLTRLPSGEERILDDDEVIHFRGFRGFGDAGLSPVMLARQALGVAIAAEEFGGRFFANDARPGLVVEWPGSMDAEQQRLFRANWDAGHRGVTRSHLMGLLTEGAKLHEVGIPARDAQFLDLRKFQLREIARLFRVPPFMLGDVEAGSVSYASVETQAIQFVVHSLRPWLVRIEQAVKRSLFSGPRDVREGVYPEFLVEGLLRGDTLSRYRAYALGRQWGFLSQNDIRRLENMEEIPGGDRYLEPLNMQPSDPDAAGAASTDERLARLAKVTSGELESLTELELGELIARRAAETLRNGGR